jgi:putative tricarboxylic transport membrane protein
MKRISACIGAMLVVAGAVATAGGAAAQTPRAPKGPVEITVGTGAGGTPDVVMRRVAKVLGETKMVEQPIVVQNRVGGSWMTAANFVLGKKGDENTLLTIAGPIFTTPIVQGQSTVYDKVTPIAMFVQGELVLAVQPNSPVKSLKDLIAQAQQRERGVKIAGAQVGATDHMVTAMIEKVANVKLNYIPFDSGSAATAAFLGGNSDLVSLSLVEAVPLVKSGKAKVIALLSDKRRTDPDFKDVPTAKEQGYDIVFFQFWGLAGPPDLDPALVKWWDEKLHKLVQSEQWKEAAKDGFYGTDYVDSTQSKAFLQKHHDNFHSILKQIGLAKL